MAEHGGFDDLGPMKVLRAAYIGMGRDPGMIEAPLGEERPEQVIAELARLIRAYQAPDKGYVARRAPRNEATPGDYDQLARHGEWDLTDPPHPERVGQ
jgi:hypothetical protein